MNNRELVGVVAAAALLGGIVVYNEKQTKRIESKLEKERLKAYEDYSNTLWDDMDRDHDEASELIDSLVNVIQEKGQRTVDQTMLTMDDKQAQNFLQEWSRAKGLVNRISSNLTEYISYCRRNNVDYETFAEEKDRQLQTLRNRIGSAEGTTTYNIVNQHYVDNRSAYQQTQTYMDQRQTQNIMQDQRRFSSQTSNQVQYNVAVQNQSGLEPGYGPVANTELSDTTVAAPGMFTAIKGSMDDNSNVRMIDALEEIEGEQMLMIMPPPAVNEPKTGENTSQATFAVTSKLDENRPKPSFNALKEPRSFKDEGVNLERDSRKKRMDALQENRKKNRDKYMDAVREVEDDLPAMPKSTPALNKTAQAISDIMKDFQSYSPRTKQISRQAVEKTIPKISNIPEYQTLITDARRAIGLSSPTKSATQDLVLGTPEAKRQRIDPTATPAEFGK